MRRGVFAARAIARKGGRVKVQKIMACAAALVGRRDLCDYLEGKGGADSDGLRRDAEQMLRCFNLAENEVALDFIPLKKEQKVSSDGVIPFSALAWAPVEVEGVFSPAGGRLHFRVTEEGIAVRSGEALVRYRARPAVKCACDEADFEGGERFLALGTACEFALMEGMLDRAAELDARYKDALAAAARSRGGRMRQRRWI